MTDIQKVDLLICYNGNEDDPDYVVRSQHVPRKGESVWIHKGIYEITNVRWIFDNEDPDAPIAVALFVSRRK